MQNNGSNYCVSSANETSEDDQMDRLAEVVPFLVPVFFSLIIVVGFIGNILVVCTVGKFREMRTTTNILILNLAVSKEPKIKKNPTILET